MTCKTGLVDNQKMRLEMQNPSTTTWEKIAELITIPLPGSTVATDDVTTLDDDDQINVAAGPFTTEALELQLLQISGSVQQRDMYRVFRAKECRKYRIICPDTKSLTYTFSASILSWKPTTEKSKKNRISVSMQPSGGVTISSTDGQIWPIV